MTQKEAETMKKESIYNKKWRHKNKEKSLAHSKVNQAIRSGFLIKKPCVICGCIKSEAHHNDYKKPLEVIWLCRIHHVKEHFPEKKKRINKRLVINNRQRQSKTSYILFEKIKELKSNGLNYREIGEKINLSKSQVYKIYNNTKYH